MIVEVDEDEWRDDVDDLADEVADGREPPPVVVRHEDGQLVLEDGNHRVEAMRRAGRTTAWARRRLPGRGRAELVRAARSLTRGADRRQPIVFDFSTRMRTMTRSELSSSHG